MSLTKKVDNWIKENLFNTVPIAIAVIDKEFNVVFANLSFEEMFGDWLNRKCYSVYKDREHNYCCNAGGGVINCGPPFKNKRVHGNKIKAKQCADTGAEILITPCHNCHSGMEDIISYYKIDMHIKFISDIMYEVMEKPEF